MAKSKPVKSKLVEKKKNINPLQTPYYTVVLQHGNEVFKGEGPTPQLALDHLGKPQKIFLKGVITITSQNKTRSKMLLPNQLKRLFYPLTQKLLAKSLFVGM